MKYDKIKNYKDEELPRLSRPKSCTFKKMIEILEEAQTKKKARGRKPNALPMKKRLLTALKYLREYLAYISKLHLSYGVSESSCYRNIKWIEETLIKHPDFALPARKALVKSDI